MSDEKKLKVGIIGVGTIGSAHAAAIYSGEIPNMRLVALCDNSPEKLDALKEKYADVPTFSSHNELIASGLCEAVIIATPHYFHPPIAIDAFHAGLCVLTEKPAGVDCASVKQMISAAKESGKTFGVMFNQRSNKLFAKAREIVASGELGEVFGIESRVQGSRGIPGDWRGKKEHGGGMILDWGVHLIDQMLLIVRDKKIEKVYCRCDHITNYEVDDGFKLDLYFEDDLTARIEVGTSHFISLPRFYMTGSNGSALIESWKSDCKIVACKNWDEKNVVPVVTAAGLTKTMAPRDKETIEESSIPSPTSDVHDFYRNVCAAIDGKESQIVTHAQLLRVMKVMEAAFRSDELGMPVEIEDEIV